MNCFRCVGHIRVICVAFDEELVVTDPIDVNDLDRELGEDANECSLSVSIIITRNTILRRYILLE